MKKLFLFIIIIIIITISIIYNSISFNSYNNKESYINNTYDNSLVYLYLKNCPRCNKFLDTWNEIENKYNQDKTKDEPKYLFNVNSYDINDFGKGEEIAKSKGINYAPSILFIIKKDPIEIREYLNEGEMKTDKILEWALNINKCNINNNS